MPTYIQTSFDSMVAVELMGCLVRQIKRLSCFLTHDAGGNQCIESFMLVLQMFVSLFHLAVTTIQYIVITALVGYVCGFGPYHSWVPLFVSFCPTLPVQDMG